MPTPQSSRAVARSSRTRPTQTLVIFLASLAGLLLEVGYTRVVSYKLWYYYTYLVIGLALLGIGSGGIFVVVVPRLRRAFSVIGSVLTTILAMTFCFRSVQFLGLLVYAIAGVALWKLQQIAARPREAAAAEPALVNA